MTIIITFIAENINEAGIFAARMQNSKLKLNYSPGTKQPKSTMQE